MPTKNCTTSKWISSQFRHSATASSNQANFKCWDESSAHFLLFFCTSSLGRFEIEIILFIVFDFNLFGSLSVEKRGEKEENEKRVLSRAKHVFPFIALLKRNSIPSDWKSSAHANYNDQRIYGTIVISLPRQCQPNNMHTSNRTKKSNFHNCMIKCVTVRSACVCGRNLHAYVKFLRWKMR